MPDIAAAAAPLFAGLADGLGLRRLAGPGRAARLAPGLVAPVRAVAPVA